MSGYAKQHSLAVGGTVTLGSVKYDIIGISKSASAEANVYMPLMRAQTLAGVKGKVNEIYVKATSATQIAQVQKEIKATVKGATVTTAAGPGKPGRAARSAAPPSSPTSSASGWPCAASSRRSPWPACLTLSPVSRRVREFGTLKAIGLAQPAGRLPGAR